jgi:hypothetical protein
LLDYVDVYIGKFCMNCNFIRDLLLTAHVTGLGRSEFESRQWQGFFLHVTSSRLPLGLHPASYPMDGGVLFSGIRRPGRKADHSPPPSAEVKNAWSYTSTHTYVFMTWYLIKHRDIFTFDMVELAVRPSSWIYVPPQEITELHEVH